MSDRRQEDKKEQDKSVQRAALKIDFSIYIFLNVCYFFVLDEYPDLNQFPIYHLSLVLSIPRDIVGGFRKKNQMRTKKGTRIAFPRTISISV